MKTLWLLAALSLVAGSLAAQATPPQARCDTPEYRQFDFWVGSWEVTSNGNPAGKNEISVEEDGCVIHERWTGAKGATGQSFNFYDRVTKRWRQVWIDNSGSPLDLSGEFRDGQMRLAGTTTTPRGPIQQRLTFLKNADGTVRQLWESSRDEGKTWAVVFDGLYRRR
ncbi:MAG: hypothetical protein FJ206_15680 [Gemmatimonadetes bacterium]|nr:hypothetical protein [Gemmatimonadota bacterium]